jgi:uncharacterized repeat protein (TIGR03803 family)
MRFTRLARLQLLSLVILVAAPAILHAQTYTDLYDLGTNTGDPHTPAWMGLFAQGRDGNIYTTSTNGGVNNNEGGTVFQLSPAGKVTVLHSFAADPKFNDGAFPQGGLMLGTDGNFYGTTPTGGIPGYGTVFKITPSGKFTIMHGFNGVSEGESPVAPPVQGNDGNFYGTTSNGGGDVFGTVYKMTPSGKLATLYTFGGVVRYPTDLILGTDGNFYGTTLGGSGTNVNGTIFKITPHGKFTLLHSFNGTDGQRPMGTIIQATDGNFYGTTRAGGSGGEGVAYKMTPAGVLTVLRNFANDTFGLAPFAGLVQATDGNFYGATTSDPGVGFGTLFQLTSKGVFTDLVFLTNFTGKFPGANPQVTLFQHTNGTLYGQTYGGGSQAKGVIYSLGMGLGPFVSFVGPEFSGKVGNTIEILGQGLTGATKVSFHGVSATFSVVSDTYMTAVVPAGATTGSVTVATHGGKLTSNRVFRVTPAILSFNPTSGPVGTQVIILGTSFTGAKKVSFGGVKATTVTVDSDTQITATVPAGALTGKIQVVTAGGTATSSGVFTVTQ